MSGLKDHEALAEQLRDQPPVPDDLARARMEKRLLAAATRREPEASRPSRTTAGRWVAVGGVALAAAAAMLFFLLRDPGPEAPVARFEVREIGTSTQRGTLEEGSVLRTGEGEVADIRIASSSVRLSPSSRVRIATLSEDRLSLELATGEVRVEFHPARRGEEHLHVTTAHARVEVVGTVFAVRAEEEATEVSVTEGRVRVVSLRGGEARMVGAGESTRVGGERTAVAAPALPVPPPVVEEPAPELDPAPSAPAQTEPAPSAPTPAQLLARARAQSREHPERAERTLRGLLRGRAPRRVRAEALTLLGDLMRRGGRAREAAEAYTEAADLGAGATSQMAIYALARLQQRQLGQPERARRSYRRYLEEAPRGPLAGQARAALCRLGDAASCER